MNNCKQRFEKRWADVFLQHLNEANGFDYKAVPTEENLPGTDITAISKSGEYPQLNIELTQSIEWDEENARSDTKWFNLNKVQLSIKKKSEKYSKARLDISETILLIQGYLSKSWMQDDIKNLRLENQYSQFKGIYYTSVETTENSAFSMSIKHIDGTSVTS